MWRSRFPPPWRNTTGSPDRKLAKASLKGKGANTKNPFVAIPCRALIWSRRNPPPNFSSCRPRIQLSDPETSNVFWNVLRGPVIGSPTEAYPPTWMNGGPAARSNVGSYWNPRLDGGSWFRCSSYRNLFLRYEKRPTPTPAGENTWVSWITKFCARSSSPTGKPGTFAPDVESGSVVGPPL